MINTSELTDNGLQTSSNTSEKGITPDIDSLKIKLSRASRLVDDIVLKKYLCSLTNYEVVPMPPEMKDIGKIRLFRITEMVYQKNEYSTYKFSSVFSALQGLDCTVYIIADSNGKKTRYEIIHLCKAKKDCGN